MSAAFSIIGGSVRGGQVSADVVIDMRVVRNDGSKPHREAILKFFDTVDTNEFGVSAANFGLEEFYIADGWELTLISRESDRIELSFARKGRKPAVPALDAVLCSVGRILSLATTAYLEKTRERREARERQNAEAVQRIIKGAVDNAARAAFQAIVKEADNDSEYIELLNKARARRVEVVANIRSALCCADGKPDGVGPHADDGYYHDADGAMWTLNSFIDAALPPFGETAIADIERFNGNSAAAYEQARRAVEDALRMTPSVTIIAKATKVFGPA